VAVHGKFNHREHKEHKEMPRSGSFRKADFVISVIFVVGYLSQCILLDFEAIGSKIDEYTFSKCPWPW